LFTLYFSLSGRDNTDEANFGATVT